MSEFAKRLKIKMEQKGIKAVDICRATGIKESALSHYLNGDYQPKQVNTELIAKYLGVSPSWLMGLYDEVGTDNDYVDYPVIGEISAGYGGIAYEETSDVESIPKNWLKGHNRDEFLVLKVKGDSCYPTLMDGDKILVRRESSVDSGTLACVIYDGELATVKRVHYKQENPTWLKLEPINSNYPPVVLEGEAELSKCVMIGKVIRAIREF